MRKNLSMLKALAVLAFLAGAGLVTATSASAAGQLPQQAQRPHLGTLSIAHTEFTLDGKTLGIGAGGGFEPLLIASTQSPEMDAWLKMPNGATPYLVSIKNAYLGEKFSLYPIVRAPSPKNGKIKIRYSVVATSPAGEKLQIVDDAVYEATDMKTSAFVACPDIVDVSFDDRFQTGKYVFSIAALDENSNRAASSSISVELQKWHFPKQTIDDEKLLQRAFLDFHLNPSPEVLCAMYFSKKLDLSSKSAPHGLNYLLLGFFKSGFARFSFAFDGILENFASFDNLDKAKIILLNSVLGKPAIPDAKLSPAQIKYQNNIRRAEIPNPYEDWHKVMGVAQLDMLWGDFFATGAYKPVRRIMNLMINADEADFAMKLKNANLRPQNDAEWNKYNVGLLHVAALRSLLRNAEMFDIVDQYCVWAVENGDLPEKSAKVLATYFDRRKPQK